MYGLMELVMLKKTEEIIVNQNSLEKRKYEF